MDVLQGAKWHLSSVSVTKFVGIYPTHPMWKSSGHGRRGHPDLCVTGL